MKPVIEKFGDDHQIVRISNAYNDSDRRLLNSIDEKRGPMLDMVRAQRERDALRSHPAPPPLFTSDAMVSADHLARHKAWHTEEIARLKLLKGTPRPNMISADNGISANNAAPFASDRSAGIGELWWAETSYILPNWLGLTLFWDEQGLRLAGGLDHSSGDLWSGSLQIFSWFGLSRDRMPPGGTRFRCTPPIDIRGEVMGSTGYHSIFGSDQWSKCWLNTTQVVHHGSQAITATFTRNLLHMDSGSELQTNFLPGYILYPSVDFDLNRELDVAVWVGCRFDFQLEGDSDFRFGGIGHMEPALMRGMQWFLQAL